MRGRGAAKSNGGRGPPADLLVCFPARAHLALLPNPTSSPSGSTGAAKRRLPGSATRGQVPRSLVRFNTRDVVRAHAVINAGANSEPTSPKVTCAGQIKVSRPKTKLPVSAAGVHKQSNWLLITEEMEKQHRRRQRRGWGLSWLEALGVNRDAIHLLHGLRMSMRCFGLFRGTAARGCTSVREENDISAGEYEEDDEEEEVEDDEEEDSEEMKHSDATQTIFSRWLRLLEENPSNHGNLKRNIEGGDQLELEEEDDEQFGESTTVGRCLDTPSYPSTSSAAAPPPPPNALLLMRCRSTPSKGWPNGLNVDGAQVCDKFTETKNMKDDEKEKDRMLLMSYAPDFFKISPDIAKETWVVGSFDPLSRCRSWKR